MRAYMLATRSKEELRKGICDHFANVRAADAHLIAHIAEYDARRFYLEDGYASMHAWCVGVLHLTTDGAYKRIQAARAARKYPALFLALADRRLDLTAIVLLAPHLTPENLDELVASATHKDTQDLRRMLTERFLQSEAALAFPSSNLDSSSLEEEGPESELVLKPVEASAATCTQPVAPQAGGLPRRVDVHLWVDQDKLEYARALLSHALPSGDLDQLFDRALDAVIREVEGKKFGATLRPRSRTRGNAPRDARSIPAHVKREVWRRDQGRCTFVGRDGHRCGERRFLEYDHARPVALGGQATVEDLRLRCRAHNQYDAERVFGPEFMAEKREAARRARAELRESRESREALEMQRERSDRVRSIASGLRNLGCRADQAKHAAEAAVAAMRPGETIEDTLRTALRSLAPPRNTHRDEHLPVPSPRDAVEPVEPVEPVAAQEVRSVEDLVPV